MVNKDLVNYILQLADNSLIIGHRIGEWCGHGPYLEVDMALTNIALDEIGCARSYYQYCAELEGGDKTEDSYPYLRAELDFKNILLVEQPNGDFAQTVARSFFFDAFQWVYYSGLIHSDDERIKAIAEKTWKEIKYHWKFTSEWVLRLGEGTEESFRRMQEGLNLLWPYTGEMFILSEEELKMQEAGVAPDLSRVKSQWEEKINGIIAQTELKLPESTWWHKGGKQGVHSEHMGYILADMQYLQRAIPNAEW